MSVDLEAFLRARFDEDERVASAATPGPWRYNPDKVWNLPGQHFGEEFVAAGTVDKPICVAGTGPADDPKSMADAAHIAQHDPARVLAEVEAKRRLIEDTWGGPDHEDMWLHHMRLLALPYVDHPDYREEWRP
ncbi:DUF6221 family protein [Streptomyces sp. NPDC053048]|uniref:DUF6221 family protein n=1 Tax=Streptomyces sp. NPDC053048 TaxID=3365694 RepID=UPI0037D09E27